MTGRSDSRRDSKGNGESRVRGWLRALRVGRNGGDSIRDTIEELIEQEDENGNAEELALFRNVLSVRDAAVEDVMVPRADIVAVDVETSLADVAQLMNRSSHSRLPVYRGRLDDVIGMVHIKDLLARRKDDSSVESIVRKLLFVAPSMRVLELLLQMRVNRIHMALVVDEFGGIDGLVSIEDLVEEIVGEIEDEHDHGNRPGLVRRGDSIDVDARLEIEDFEKETGSFLSEAEREEVHTMGGLVFYIAGRVPGRGEVIRHETGIEFEILEADPRRIRRIRATGVPSGESE